jgi:hypothetical protein
MGELHLTICFIGVMMGLYFLTRLAQAGTVDYPVKRGWLESIFGLLSWVVIPVLIFVILYRGFALR